MGWDRIYGQGWSKTFPCHLGRVVVEHEGAHIGEAVREHACTHHLRSPRKGAEKDRVRVRVR